MLDGASTETLNACNLDKNKLERKTKYLNYNKGEAVQKGKGRRLVDESSQCKEIKDYVQILAIPLNKEQYELAIKNLDSLDKDITKAFMIAILGEY
jgi:hypothetical protein